GGEVFGLIDAVLIFDAHAGQALLLFGLHDQTAEHIAVETANGSRRDHPLGSATRAHDCVHAGANDGRGDSGGKVAVTDQANARPCRSDIGNQLFMTRTVEHDDDQIFDVTIQTPGNVFKIVSHRSIEFDSVLARRADYDFFHVAVGSIQQAAAFG